MLSIRAFHSLRFKFRRIHCPDNAPRRIVPEALQVDVTDSCIPAAIASDDVWAVGDNGGQGITMH